MTTGEGPGPAFDPPAGLPAPSGVDPATEDDSGNRRRVLWAFGAAAALFGAGVVGLALPSGGEDGVNVNTNDTIGPSTSADSSPAPNEDVRTLVAPVFAPFTFSASNAANTTSSVPAGITPTTTAAGVTTATPSIIRALAGVSAHGITNITITPPPPVTNTPVPPGTPVTPGSPGGPDPGTTAPTTVTQPTSPPTTKPPRPPRTTTTTIPTTATTSPTTVATTTTATDPATTTTTIADTTTTEPTTTIADTTTTTIADTTTTTIADTTTTEPTTTVEATTTSIDPPPSSTDPPAP